MSLHFVLGGARSGKSALAEDMVLGSGLQPLYLATGRAFDTEMRARIHEHRERRPPPWETIEEPLALPQVLAREARGDRAILVDCLTLWLTNLMLEDGDISAGSDALADVLRTPLPGLVVIVSNEVGLSIVPDNRMARAFRDHAGRLHQRVAALADAVTFVAAGLPLKLKG
ncbi:bifunctional adenosylcobinamide kinase/adenosylcobinamide-phosphate guanylyltransferase [Aureimonas sp. Leaf324]|jgi:adenosylcobinamide kinase/adenosylcobinamide-phosphate guanylyltransferase|uniref:bifunctional adenosylcobinamide kinase/adenosylcobinamide-phosphate guanylyltransferase n=1 Tax=Aureimonas sp. Leaf324 TaxID=1736336 RepID=UPI0006FFDA1D|nr:bifunctional adenosylcobinamide kinase/adenosylcobinamide-phosphate guanylyltransferase [Aureimonas sp. Leaf324]KQQ80642.1 adenosylcobinamide kinase/adenosylcobinamide phosphate guanyltransferase [Aureimonas sp. Leaf324]